MRPRLAPYLLFAIKKQHLDSRFRGQRFTAHGAVYDGKSIDSVLQKTKARQCRAFACLTMTTNQTAGTVTPYVHDTLYASAMALISELK
jgi:hypothetical protein